MSDNLVCCRNVGERSCATPALKRMVVFDWYDGPSGGLLACDTCAAVYSFVLTDWSDDHSTRVFGLRRMPNGTIDEVSRLVREPPSWPIWFPARLKSPSQGDQVAIDNLDKLLATAAAPSLVVAWSDRLGMPRCARLVPPDLSRHVVDLLEREDARSGFDWLAYLGLER